MKSYGIHHVSVEVKDLAAGQRFYQEVLGLELMDRPSDLGVPGVWLRCGGQQIHLLAASSKKPRKTDAHFAIEVKDLMTAQQTLIKHGISTTEPAEVKGIGRQIFFDDPWGNIIELHEPLIK